MPKTNGSLPLRKREQDLNGSRNAKKAAVIYLSVCGTVAGQCHPRSRSGEDRRSRYGAEIKPEYTNPRKDRAFAKLQPKVSPVQCIFAL